MDRSIQFELVDRLTLICTESGIGESYENFVSKRALVKYQSQSEMIKGMLYVVPHLKILLNFEKFKFLNR